ncbi:MAG: 4-hydroxy-tetrahydrodipicolinate synthase [Lachnospiraceae bacterium]|nr:4-hydroxy-tetrahydrodipicolinate synthase [Lachnospiraceae bacterium]
MAIFKGAGVAIITPFNDDDGQKVNYDAFGKLIDWQIEKGTDSIIVCGTSGEAATLSDEEHKEVIRFCVEKVDHRVPVIAGTGSNDTRYAIQLSKEAEDMGVDALLSVTPYYNKTTQEGIYRHYEAISENVNIPIIVYNVPSRTGLNVLPETMVRMAKGIKNITAVKEASGNINQIARLAALADGCLDIYSGNDDHIVPVLSLGGIGVISVLSNVAPKETHEICSRFFEGDVEGSRKEQLRAIDLVDSLFCEVNPVPVKEALNMMGRDAGPVRLPLTEMGENNKARLRRSLEAYGLI